MPGHKIIGCLLSAFLAGLLTKGEAQTLFPSSAKERRLLLEDLNLSPHCLKPSFLGFDFNGFEAPCAAAFSHLPDRKSYALHYLPLSSRFGGSLSIGWAHLSENPVQVVAMGTDNKPVRLRSLQSESGGLDMPRDSNGFVKFNLQSRPVDWIFLDGTFWGGVNSLATGKPWYHLPEAYGEFRFRSFLFVIGRKQTNWGQSFVGPLLLSDNGTAMDSIRMTTLPVVLPWFLSSLGPMKAEIFYSRMNADRVPENDHFVGLRLGMQPSHRFELNLGMHYQFLGKGIKGGSADEILLEILGGRKNLGPGVHDASNITNRAAEIDFRLSFNDWVWPTSFYGENHLEDCCGGWYYFFHRQLSYIYGIYTRMGSSLSSPRLRLEYVRTGNKLYYHATWPSALSNDGALLGHPIGNDAQGVYFEWADDWAQLGLKARFFWEERNRRAQIDFGDIYSYRPTFEESEKRFGVAPGILCEWGSGWTADLRASIVRVLNKENFGGRNTLEWGTGIIFGYHF